MTYSAGLFFGRLLLRLTTAAAAVRCTTTITQVQSVGVARSTRAGAVRRRVRCEENALVCRWTVSEWSSRLHCTGLLTGGCGCGCVFLLLPRSSDRCDRCEIGSAAAAPVRQQGAGPPDRRTQVRHRKREREGGGRRSARWGRRRPHERERQRSASALACRCAPAEESCLAQHKRSGRSADGAGRQPLTCRCVSLRASPLPLPPAVCASLDFCPLQRSRLHRAG